MLESQEYEDNGDLAGLLFMKVPSVQVNRETGELAAVGPGRITTLREGFQAGVLNDSNPQVERSVPQSDGPLRTFLQVDYQKQIRGNLYRRIVKFEDRVQVLYGPVKSWNETLRADGPLGTEDVLLTCNRLTVSQSSLARGSARTFDLVANGNTFVEGQTFTAQGDQVSFDQGKGQLILQGTGSTDAVLTYQVRVGAPRSKVEARKILYWPATKHVAMDDARFLDIGQLGL